MSKKANFILFSIIDTEWDKTRMSYPTYHYLIRNTDGNRAKLEKVKERFQRRFDEGEEEYNGDPFECIAKEEGLVFETYEKDEIYD